MYVLEFDLGKYSLSLPGDVPTIMDGTVFASSSEVQTHRPVRPCHGRPVVDLCAYLVFCQDILAVTHPVETVALDEQVARSPRKTRTPFIRCTVI